MEKENFLKDSVLKIAAPITMQSVFQASFSVIDQIMTGRLGSVSVAGIGLGSKFASLYSVLLGAVVAAAGIMIAQYVGSRSKKGIQVSLFVNMLIAALLAVIFTLLSILLPGRIMSAYSADTDTVQAAAGYLRVLSYGFLPMLIVQFLSMLLCSTNLAKLPMYGSILSIVLNIALDYTLIFGKGGMPALGVAGAAWATTIARMVNAFFLAICFLYAAGGKSWNWGIKPEEEQPLQEIRTEEQKSLSEAESILNVSLSSFFKILLPILLPVLLCEFLWSLGENVYAVIYGRMSTADCAAMTLLNPVQALVIGALSGLSSAAGILIGKLLGEEKFEEAYARSQSLMWYGLIGSGAFSLLLLVIAPLYVRLFLVEEEVKELTMWILVAFAAVSPLKVQNMILGGGILRSGGQTKYVLMIDAIGTWCFGIPLGLLAAFVLSLPIYWVYFMLSLEEGVRLLISFFLFRRKKWMQNVSQLP